MTRQGVRTAGWYLLLAGLLSCIGAALAQPQAGPGHDGMAARGSDTPAFVETEVDDAQPYVQQSVGVVVRLYYAMQLASGELELDTPANAALQRVGNDRSFAREVNGRRYNVVERRFLLVPERSGPLQLAGARFSGRGVSGFFDDVFGRSDGQFSARSADQTLQVQAMPDVAAQPWLPLKALRLRYVNAPSGAVRAGEAVTVDVEATAIGATRAQLPELPVPALGDAAQVFAEPAQYDERFDGGSPQVTLTRRYSIVPRQPGTLVVPGLQLQWWDVAAAQARTASVPELSLQVTPGAVGTAPVAVAPVAVTPGLADDSKTLATPVQSRPAWGWPALAAGFALLWLATLVWGLSRRRPPAAAPAGTAVVPGARYAVADLRRALDIGALDEIVQILVGMSGGGSVDEVIARLDDKAQRDALEYMQRARWGGGGDLAQVRTRLREAFRTGPHWRVAAKAEVAALEPLYPEGR